MDLDDYYESGNGSSSSAYILLNPRNLTSTIPSWTSVHSRPKMSNDGCRGPTPNSSIDLEWETDGIFFNERCFYIISVYKIIKPRAIILLASRRLMNQCKIFSYPEIQLSNYSRIVVYFNQHLGAVHPKRWLKSAFSHFFNANM